MFGSLAKSHLAVQMIGFKELAAADLRINGLEDELSGKDDAVLSAITGQLRDRLANGEPKMTCCEAFAGP